MSIACAVLTLLLLAAVVAIIVSVRTTSNLVREVDRLTAERTRLHGAVDAARQAFDRYANLHFAKGTPDGDKKAHANATLAGVMKKALQDTRYRPPSLVTQISDIVRSMRVQ